MTDTQEKEAVLEHRGGRLRGCLFRLVALSISGLLVLVAAEIAIRILMPQVLFPRYVTGSEFGIRVNVPNVSYWHTSPEMSAEFRINSMGMRSDREYAFEKPQGTIRIVGLGDSFTQGYEVELEQSFLFLLELGLQERGHQVEVLNLAVSGYSTAEELIILRQFGFRFAPDVVVVGYFQNDPEDNVRSGLFRLGSQGELERAAASYLPAVGFRDALYRRGLYRWLAQKSHLVSLMREQLTIWVKRYLYRENHESPAGAGGAADGPRRDALLTARLLDQLKLECVQQGAHFVVLDIPAGEYAESNLPVDLLREVKPEEIVRTLPALQAASRESDPYRRRGHGHWTPVGHRVAAQLLIDHIAGRLASPEAAKAP